jgi:hypothetical protein
LYVGMTIQIREFIASSVMGNLMPCVAADALAKQDIKGQSRPCG